MSVAPIDSIGGIVLCGGRSTRMGQPKLALPFGPEVMLQRIVRVLSQVVHPIVVVAAPEQALPELPGDVLIARDEQEALGPLAGLAIGLRTLRPFVRAAYASACDVPLLQPEFVRRIAASLGTHALVMPRDGKYHHPLAGVYRTELADGIQGMIAENRMRPIFLLDDYDALTIDVEDLRSADPGLDSLRNTNTPEEYAAALRDAGFA